MKFQFFLALYKYISNNIHYYIATVQWFTSLTLINITTNLSVIKFYSCSSISWKIIFSAYSVEWGKTHSKILFEFLFIFSQSWRQMVFTKSSSVLIYWTNSPSMWMNSSSYLINFLSTIFSGLLAASCTASFCLWCGHWQYRGIANQSSRI